MSLSALHLGDLVATLLLGRPYPEAREARDDDIAEKHVRACGILTDRASVVSSTYFWISGSGTDASACQRRAVLSSNPASSRTVAYSETCDTLSHVFFPRPGPASRCFGPGARSSWAVTLPPARSALSLIAAALFWAWVPHDTRDQIVDSVRRWSDKTEIGCGRLMAWLDIAASEFYGSRERHAICAALLLRCRRYKLRLPLLA